MDPAEAIQQVANEVTGCKLCDLHRTATRGVPGEGPVNAEIMLIGEAPGFYEDQQGRPFVGASGKFLEELLSRAGIKRSEVFITNVVKHRPPSNRDPEPGELLACRSFIERQIEAINPKVIVTLGRFSMALFLVNAKISQIHGKATWIKGRLIVPMFHPAAALHQPDLKDAVLADFAKLPRYIAMAGEAGRQSAGPVPSNGGAPSPQEAAQAVSGVSSSAQSAPAEPPMSNEGDKPVQLSLF